MSIAAPDRVERAAAASAPPHVRKRARVWWLVHQWAGLKLSIFLSFILLTGTLATLSHEMDWLMRPALRVNPASVEGPVDWAAIARKAAARHPDYKIESIETPVASAFAAQLMVERPDGSAAYLYAHPTTGEIQGEGHWVGAQRVLRNMHRHLNMPVWLGVPIVSSLALLLLVSLVTSLVVYKKWWRGMFKPIRRRDARTAWGDFHRLAGVWSLWFLTLMILTGIWYLAEETVARAPNLPSAEAEAVAELPDDLPQRLERALAAAHVADPELRIRGIWFPSADSPVFKIEGQKDALLVRHRANAVFTDLNGNPLLLADARDLSVHQRISEAADPLHFGNFGGYWTKIPWFLFGLLLTSLSVSGVALYAMRLSKTQTVKGNGTALLVKSWGGMGPWRWPALALILTGLALIPSLFSGT